jgi:hypothetical protein
LNSLAIILLLCIGKNFMLLTPTALTSEALPKLHFLEQPLNLAGTPGFDRFPPKNVPKPTEF